MFKQLLEVLSSSINLDADSLKTIRDGAFAGINKARDNAIEYWQDSRIDRAEAEDRIESLKIAFPDYTGQKPVKEWLLVFQSGGSNKYHYYMITSDGKGWKGNGRIGAAPAMNAVEPAAKSRTVEQEIEKIMASKQREGYELVDISAVERGELIAKHKGDDARAVEQALTADIRNAGVVTIQDVDVDGWSLGYSFSYGGFNHRVWMNNQGNVYSYFGIPEGSYSGKAELTREKNTGSFNNGVAYIKELLTNKEKLDKIVSALE